MTAHFDFAQCSYIQRILVLLILSPMRGDPERGQENCSNVREMSVKDLGIFYSVEFERVIGSCVALHHKYAFGSNGLPSIVAPRKLDLLNTSVFSKEISNVKKIDASKLAPLTNIELLKLA